MLKIGCRYSSFFFQLILATLVCSFVPSYAQQIDSARGVNAIDGVYEFVSERSTLTKPISIDDKDTISAPKWKGVWIFQKGYFSTVLMQNRRFELPEEEDCDLGYRSYAGTYAVKGDRLTLIQTFSLSEIFEGRPVVLLFRREGTSLILIQELRAHPEDGREGQVTTTLRKLK